jgi:hypothetical protein
MLKEILSVSGKSGLFKRVSQGKNLLIAESLLDGKRIPLYPRDKVISLGDIAIFSTDGEDRPLSEIFLAIKTKEAGKQVEVDTSNPVLMKNYLAEVFPEFDKDRVYPSDVKKMIGWYNLLISKGFDDFEIKDKPEEDIKDVPKEKPKELAAKLPKAAPKEVKKKVADKKISRNKQG